MTYSELCKQVTSVRPHVLPQPGCIPSQLVFVFHHSIMAIVHFLFFPMLEGLTSGVARSLSTCMVIPLVRQNQYITFHEVGEHILAHTSILEQRQQYDSLEEAMHRFRHGTIAVSLFLLPS